VGLTEKELLLKKRENPHGQVSQRVPSSRKKKEEISIEGEKNFLKMTKKAPVPGGRKKRADNISFEKKGTDARSFEKRNFSTQKRKGGSCLSP